MIWRYPKRTQNRSRNRFKKLIDVVPSRNPILGTFWPPKWLPEVPRRLQDDLGSAQIAFYMLPVPCHFMLKVFNIGLEAFKGQNGGRHYLTQLQQWANMGVERKVFGSSKPFSRACRRSCLSFQLLLNQASEPKFWANRP